MKRKLRVMLMLVGVLIAGVLAVPWALIGAGEPNVAPSNGFAALTKDGPTTSWKVETVLGGKVVELLARGQRCYRAKVWGAW